MNPLLDFTRNSIWQGFAALTDYDGGLQAPKSRLKVFVASLGTILDSNGAENGLNDFRSSSALNFTEFEYYLTHEVFSSVDDAMSRVDLSLLEKRIDDVCWTLTKSKLDWNRRDSPLDRDSAFKIFRIFCLLGDLVRDDDGNAQVLISPEEADLVFHRIIAGVTKEWDVKEEFESLFSNAIFDFQTFLSVIELRFLKEFQRNEVIEVIQDIYDEFVDDIIRKGSLLKRGEYLPKYVERLFILRPSGITYFTNPKKSKFLKFDAQTRIEEGNSNSKSKLYGFNVITSERVLQLAALDKRYGTQWFSSVKLAISRFHCQESYGRHLRNKRRLEWHRQKIRRQQEMERTNEILMAEKMARQAAEDYAKELALQKAEEEAQKIQLDQIRHTLEKLLAEEIQAKKDEELVRMLQARILNEEWEKRDELERLQEEQRHLLDVERNKTKTFQRRQIEMEQMLEEAELKLLELENSRREMDIELKAARQKNAERNREILETRMKLFTAPIVEDEKVKRTRRCVSMREGKNHVRPILPRFDIQDNSF